MGNELSTGRQSINDPSSEDYSWGLTWVCVYNNSPSLFLNDHGSPVNAGYDLCGSRLYVGRARYAGDTIPGKVNPRFNSVLVPYGGREHHVYDYEVLYAKPNTELSWVRTRTIPSNAIVAGRQSDGARLFIGRARHGPTCTPGKIHETWRRCFIGYSGIEHGDSQDYEILCGGYYIDYHKMEQRILRENREVMEKVLKYKDSCETQLRETREKNDMLMRNISELQRINDQITKIRNMIASGNLQHVNDEFRKLQELFKNYTPAIEYH